MFAIFAGAVGLCPYAVFLLVSVHFSVFGGEEGGGFDFGVGGDFAHLRFL